jgi:acyl-CoA synthetase (AMP-forming)/AMP-acid ligase II
MEFITDYLVYNCKKYPNKPAIIFGDNIVSWRELGEKVFNYSQILKKLVKGEQKIVGIFLSNSIEFVVAHLSILYLKHISWPIDPLYKEVELEMYIKQLKPELVITDEHRASQIKNTKVEIFMRSEINKKNKWELNKLQGDPRKTAATILFTSGTTTKPKATLYSHFNHLWNVKTISKLWRWKTSDTLLLSLPLSHWHGLVIGLTGSIYNGSTVYLQEKFNINETLKMLSSGKISLFMHVPHVYQKLVEHPNWMNYQFKKVRLFVSGSAHLPPALFEEFYKKYKAKILERYASSEAGVICSNLYNKRIPGSVGKPLPGVKIKLIDEKGNEVKDGEGEILVKSPGVFMGYYDETGIHYFKDEFLKTGDIGFIKNGYVFLKGRVQEKIKKYGYTLFPRDIESVLNKHPNIIESYVTGIQKGNLSDELVYFVVCKNKISEDEIIKYCKQNMPHYWLPDKIIFLLQIPRTKTGKPHIHQLLQIYKKST